MVDRIPLSKTIRFEVLKRDSFACQYCGKKAPDVLLQVDHIHPVAEGAGTIFSTSQPRARTATAAREPGRCRMRRSWRSSVGSSTSFRSDASRSR